MKQYKLYIVALISLYTLSSCEKVVDIDLPDGKALPYVDAWITDQPGKQQIKFLRAVNYLENKEPEVITGAQISVKDITDNITYDFTYANGAYTYDAGAAAIGIIGHEYKLSINWDGELFEATDKLNRNTKIDSITTEYKDKEDGEDEIGYYAEFFANDVPAGTDYYWIRTYKNGALNANVEEMTCIDASFYEDVSDGYVFIEPLREGITSGDKPYAKGDVVQVLIRAMSKPTYEFLDQLLDQLYSGGMFAKVLQNVPTNITSQKAGSTNKIYGWFGTVSETSLSKTMQ